LEQHRRCPVPEICASHLEGLKNPMVQPLQIGQIV
jgi:hypothetical protein